MAGVKDRVYKNAVYKINTGKTDKKIYVSAEYATPLRTFAEVFNHAGIHTGEPPKRCPHIFSFNSMLTFVWKFDGLVKLLKWNFVFEIKYFLEYYNKHKNDIVLQFYLTLKKVLEKDRLNEFCELIYYEGKLLLLDVPII